MPASTSTPASGAFASPPSAFVCDTCGSPGVPVGGAYVSLRSRISTGRLVPRECVMPGGREPYVYWVDLDSGVSYWQPPPPAMLMGGAVSGLDGLWSPRGVVGAAERDVLPLPLEPMMGAKAKGYTSANVETAATAASGRHVR